jgi:hypothetical protein
MYVLHRRWYKTAQRAMLAQLTETQRVPFARNVPIISRRFRTPR